MVAKEMPAVEGYFIAIILLQVMKG